MYGQVENMWACLVSDFQNVTETLCDDQGDTLAFSFQQCICGNGGAHANEFDGAQI